MAVQPGVALLERAVADALELAARRLAVGEVGIAVAEVGCEIEAQALGELARALDRAVVGEALEHLAGREQNRLVVTATLGLRAVERRALADRDEHVLQLCAASMVRVHVAGRDRLHAEHIRELSQRGVPATSRVERPLELDEEAVAERLRRPAAAVFGSRTAGVPRAAGKTDEPVVQLEQELDRQRGSSGGSSGLGLVPACAAVRSRQRFA